MVVECPIPTMKGERKVRIETHAALGVGIWVQYEVILPNKSQMPDLLARAKSERFRGFSGEGNGESEPFKGLFLLHGKHDF
jgi:hypothetical protein